MINNKKFKFLIIPLLALIIFGSGILILREFYDTSTIAAELKTQSDNTITFNCGYLDKYIHLSSRIEEKSNVENLNYKIINPKGITMDEGILDKNNVNYIFKGEKGEWKIQFDFPKEDQTALINYNVKTNSKNNI